MAEKVWKKESELGANLSIILIDDNHIRELNKRFLSKNSVTDVIAFPLSDNNDVFEGEVYVSVDRVVENAHLYCVKASQELERMVVHGILHFLGYQDKTCAEKQEMTAKENYYISLNE